MINVLLINLNVSCLCNSLHTSMPGNSTPNSIQVLRGCRSDFMVSRCAVQKLEGGGYCWQTHFSIAFPPPRTLSLCLSSCRDMQQYLQGMWCRMYAIVFPQPSSPRKEGEGWIPSGGRVPKHSFSRYGIHSKFNVFSLPPLEIATGLIVIGEMRFLPFFSSFTICHVPSHYSQLHNNLHNAEKPATATKVIYFNNCPIFLWRSRNLHQNGEDQPTPEPI